MVASEWESSLLFLSFGEIKFALPLRMALVFALLYILQSANFWVVLSELKIESCLGVTLF